MKYGFVKVCAATPEMRVADVDFNTQKIIDAIKESAANGSQLTVFPELCVCGYTCGDLFNQPVLISACENGIRNIVEATKGIKTLVFVGAPIRHDGKLFNCAIAIHNGKILAVIPKTFLPNYGEFYERRHFSSSTEVIMDYIGLIDKQFVPFTTKILFMASNCPGFTVAAEICEDLWTVQSPSLKHAQRGANIIVNLSCSDETVGKADYRRTLIKAQSGKLVCGYVYCDAGEGESSTDMTFAGHNLIAENGNILAESKLFENGLVYSEIDVEMLESERCRMAGGYYTDLKEEKKEQRGDDGYYRSIFETFESEEDLSRKFSQTPFVPENSATLSDRSELVLTIQQKGLEKRLKHTGSKTVLIGISGGLDSALALLVTCRAFKSLGKNTKDIIAVTMPGYGTTKKTKGNSLRLIEALGATAKTIPVSGSVLKHFKDIGHDPDDRNVTYENAQARMRTMVLMDLANDMGGLVIGTCDLSETALGWSTYNGDHMAMYGVNASVPKTLVKHLIAYEAEKLGGEVKKILTSILNTEISPELLPPDENGNIAQKTEDIVGPYILHDFFIYYALRYAFAPDKIMFIAETAFEGVFDKKTIKKWLKSFYERFFKHQFKRSCMPDGVKVGSVSLSPRGDWRMPSDAVASVWLDYFK
ncbi:MAG: NAD(+) synthase [Clostridia bacterium]|nr:NAD(+) synthase [Clostridia bacterium]